MTRSRVITGNAAQAVDRFDFPSVDASPAEALRGAQKGSAHLLTAGQLDELQKQVRDEAFQRGYAEGIAAGKAEAASRAAKLAALGTALARPLENLERAVEEELLGLSIALASHLVRREIDHAPDVLATAVHECLAVLPSSARDVVLHLHPADAALLKAELAPGADQRFRIADDKELARGDVRVTSAATQVDGRLETRLKHVLAAAQSGPPEDLA
jgi:flagellar assembly protein FliH